MAAAAVGEAPRKRIRDFLRLAKNNPNPHEAALARERAADLLMRYGLTEADVEERANATAQLAPAQEGNAREDLARAIAQSRGVEFSHDSGQVTFKGYPEAAKDACQLFTALTNVVEKNGAEVTYGQADEKYLWRTCFWWGFVTAVKKQLALDIPPEALSRISQSITQAPVIVERAANAFDSIQSRSDYSQAERFKAYAHDSGKSLGESVAVPRYNKKKVNLP